MAKHRYKKEMMLYNSANRQNSGAFSHELPEVWALNEFLRQRIVGQDKAIETVCFAYEDQLNQRLLTDKDELGKPTGLLVFGPSSTGKSLLAREVAHYFNGDDSALLILDGTDYQHGHNISRLLGSPPGYVGHDRMPELSTENLMRTCQLQIKQDKQKEGQILSPKELAILRLYQNMSKHLGLILSSWINRKEIRHFLRSYMNDLTNELELASGSGKEHILQKEILKIRQELRDVREECFVIQKQYRRLDQYSMRKNGEFDHAFFMIEQQAEAALAKASQVAKKQSANITKGKIIILVDELEKAHPDFLRVFFPILDRGFVTLATGEIVSFQDAFIFFTTNVGEKQIAKHQRGENIGFGTLPKNTWDNIRGELRKHFSAPFRARIDYEILFRSLLSDELFEIAKRKLTTWKETLKKRGMVLVIEKDVIWHIVKESEDHPELGARLLNKKLRSNILRPLRRALRQRRNKQGRISIRIREGEIYFDQD